MSFLLNPLRELTGLLAGPPLLVGDVLSITDGVAQIEEPGGGMSTARGVATVGDRVYFRNGVIEGPAPALPIDIIDI
jgi:hypothetical protein